jgi:hypothetical protein
VPVITAVRRYKCYSFKFSIIDLSLSSSSHATNWFNLIKRIIHSK